MSQAKIVELDFGKVEIREDGIMTFCALPEMETIHLSQLETLLDTLVELSEGEPKLFYADNSKMKSLGHKERQYIGTNLHLFAKASAVKENSVVIRSIGYAINHLFPPKVPMQMFKTEEQAIDWLNSLK
jgi:hypothetical protein